VSDVLINLVLDKSGSMGGRSLEAATCEGINAFFKEQRELDGKAYLSMTLFDTGFDVRFVGADLSEVPDLGTDGNRYVPSGGTALYDAVVTTIKGTDQWLLNHRDFTGKVVCVINTDGEENSSKSTSIDDVNNLITEKTNQGWEFVFMGVGKAGWTEGQQFTSIPAANYFRSEATASATGASYAGVSRSLSASRVGGAAFSNSNADQVITGDDD